MGDRRNGHVGMFAPNLVNICVDEKADGEMKGKIYHCYDQNPWVFSNVVQLLRQMETFFDAISFPQSSTETRSFKATEKKALQKLNKVCELSKITEYKGEKGTFVTHVQYRQNATWQGTVFWVEKDCQREFSSTLDFLKLLDNALN